MGTNDKARFRITPVPGQPLVLPPVTCLYGEYYVSDEALEVGDVEDLDVYPDRDVRFGEVYLELYALDLDDSAAIRRFVERYGVLGVHSLVWGSEHCHHYMGFPWQPHFTLATKELANHIGRGGRLDSWWECEAEFRFGAECIRDMTTAWRVANSELDANEAVWLCRCWENAVDPIASEDNEPEIRAFFREQAPRFYEATPGLVLTFGMEDSLKPFSPRIATFEDEMLARPDPEENPYGGEIPLFSVLCLELYNHIAEQASYRRCENETCGRFFVRQSGRSEHGQYRTRGVKYCSAECSRRQAQRAYRRRKASSAPS